MRSHPKITKLLGGAVVVVLALGVGLGLSRGRMGAGARGPRVSPVVSELAEFPLSSGQGLELRQLEIPNPAGFPPGTRIKIQRLFVNLTHLSAEGLVLDIENGRLILPDSDPVMFGGTVRRGKWDFNLYAKNPDVRQVLAVWSLDKTVKPVEGNLDGVDLYLRGTWLRPKVTGQVGVERISVKPFELKGCLVLVDLALTREGSVWRTEGQLSAQGGDLSFHKTVVRLAESKFLFKGALTQPEYVIRGQAKIEQVEVGVVARGTVDRPEIQLNSDPPLPQDQLLVMLATGRSWKGTAGSLEKGTVAPDVAKELLDYFMFAGQGTEWAEKWGIRDVSLKLDKDVKGVAVKKDLFEKLEIGYDVQQVRLTPFQDEVKQTIGGEYQLTDQIAVGAQRQLRQLNARPGGALDVVQPPPRDKIYLQFKSRF